MIVVTGATGQLGRAIIEGADAENYRSMRLAALERDPDAFGSVHAVEAARPIADFVERLATSTVFGAYVEGRIVGIAGLKQEVGPKNSHKGFIWGLYVQAEHRGQGVGAALIEAVIAAARTVGEQLTLAVVQDNGAAISLYRRFGFETYGTEPRALKTPNGYSDEVLMALVLPSGSAGPLPAEPTD